MRYVVDIIGLIMLLLTAVAGGRVLEIIQWGDMGRWKSLMVVVFVVLGFLAVVLFILACMSKLRRKYY